MWLGWDSDPQPQLYDSFAPPLSYPAMPKFYHVLELKLQDVCFLLSGPAFDLSFAFESGTFVGNL